jgi:hypothetical protein
MEESLWLEGRKGGLERGELEGEVEVKRKKKFRFWQFGKKFFKRGYRRIK